jgi:hypothetical protein
MDEQVIDDLYSVAISKGYKKSRQEFVGLLHSDNDVMNDMYSYVQSKGYGKGMDDFKSLVGATSPIVEIPVVEEPVKKKGTGLPSVDGGSELTRFDPASGQVVQEAPAFTQPEVKIPEQKLPARTEFQFQPGKPLPEQKTAPLPKFVEEQLSAVTPELIGKTEENVVPQLKYQFGPLGFKFEETRAGDYMMATSPSGESIYISLDITDSEDRKSEANKLNAFLRKGTTAVKNLSSLQKQYTDSNKKIVSQKELDDSLASINAEETKIMARNAEFVKAQNKLEAEKAQLESVPVQQRKNPAYIARVNDFIERADQFSGEFQTFVKDAEDLSKRGQQLNKSIGKYTEMKAEQGTWYGAGLNAFANKSYYNMAKGFTGLTIDLLGEFLPKEALMSQDDYEKNFIDQAKKEGIAIPEGEDFADLTSKMDAETIARIENKVRDLSKKIVKGDMMESLGVTSDMMMKASGVSPEYYKSIENNFVGGALLGTLSSIPAMAGGSLTRTVLMGSQILGGIDEEMSNDPAFTDISENEKYLVKGPITVAVALLEKAGLSNLLNQKGFLNGLVLKALGKASAGASYKTLGGLISNEIDNVAARGALTLGAGFLAEAETGALQEVADITAKEIYNMAKEKEMFDTPDSVVQFIEQVGKAGLQEGIGAGVLAVPGSVSAAYTGKGFLGMDDTQFAMFEKMANDSNIQKGFVARLKSRINNSEITTAEGKDILNNYINSVGLFNSLPENLDMQGKKEAMNLLKEKRDLERQIDGKDQALTTPQRNRVNEINQQLTKLSEDAVQKQAAGEVPVQPGATVGQEVAQGEPQAEPQGIAQEGQEVATPTLDLDGEISLLEQLLAEEETAPTVSAGISISSDTDVEELRNRTQSRSQQATTKEEKESSSTRLKIIDTAKRAINTLKSVFPDIDIVMHEDEGSYNAAMQEIGGKAGSRGNFFSDTADGKTTGRIDINLSNANSRTVAHEIAHGILIKTFGDNSNLFNDFRTRVSKVLKGDVNKQLNDFADQYVDKNTGELLDVNHEEFLAELTGILEQQEANLSVTTMQKVAALINEFVSKITGGKFKPFEDTKNTKDVVDFFNTISGAIREGNEIQQLNSQEPYSSGVALPVINPNEFVGKKFRSQLEIGDYKFPSGIDILRIANLPIKTLTELVKQYEGRVVIITSDATGYGVDKNGDPILGGFGFASNEKNVTDGIGFASVSTGTVKGTYTAAEKAYGSGKTLVLIMIQPPHTTINNSYGSKYILRGLKQIAASSKEELIKTKEAIKSFIKGSTTIQKELKKTDANQKRGSEKRLFDFIDSIDENTNLEEAVKEFLNDTTFTIRTVLGQGILFKNKDIRASKSTNYSKIALNNFGYNIYDFLKEYGDNTFLTDDLILNNTGGYVVGGFELDVLPKEQREALINDTQNKGIVHPLFNAKLPGTNHFRLDALYGVQENFAEYAVPDTQISLSKEERDELVRQLYKDDNFYKASARELPLEERSYTNLTVPAKTEFKNNYLKPRGLLIEAVPNVSTKVAKGEGFIPKKGAAKQIAKGDFVSRAQLPGNDAQRIVKVGRDNGLSDQAISNVLEKRGFTQGAIDIALGKKKPATKKAPSANKIIGKPAKKKVTVDEMAALKDQIKLEARAAREAKGDLNKKRKALAARIIAARRKGVITDVQARAIVNRISKVNLDNPIMVDRLIEYTDKVFENANYAAEMTELRKLQKQAKSRNHTSMTNIVNQFTSINPEDIPLVDKETGEPLTVIQDYKEALDFLNNRTPSYDRMNKMLSTIESYKVSEKFDAVKTNDDLIDKYKSIMSNKIKTVEDYVALIKDINTFKRKAYQLFQNEAITQEEYDDLIDGAGQDQAKIEEKFTAQIAQIKKNLISDIKSKRPEKNDDFTAEENDLIKKYLELSDTDLKSLSPEELFILNDLLENIKNGEIDVYRFGSIISKADGNSNAEQLAPQLESSKVDMSYEKGREKLSEYESSFWEGLLGLGRVTSGALQKFVVSPFIRAISSYEDFLKTGLNQFLKIKNKYKIDRFDVLNNAKEMHKIGMLTTYLQEYMAQFDADNKGVKDIGKRDWFREILNSESIRGDYPEGNPSFTKRVGIKLTEIQIIEKIWNKLPKDSNGNVNPKAVYDSYMANDGKFFTENQRGFFNEIMEWKRTNITSKQKAANEFKGNPFKEIPFHMLRSRYGSQDGQIKPTTSGDSGIVRIKAGTGKERVSEKVGAINTDFQKLFITGLEQTGRDYFLSKALMDINNTLSSTKKKLDGKKDSLMKTISYTLSDALAYEFDRTKNEMILSVLLSARGVSVLLEPTRTVGEFISTFLSFPLRAKTPSGYKNLFGSQVQMRKLLEFTESPLRLRQNINKAIDINDGRIEPQGILMKATNYLSGLPERTMMVTSWMPTFTNEFQVITKEKFDPKKFNDSQAYREKYGKAIREAAAVADAQTEKIVGATTKAGQRREARLIPEFIANAFGKRGTISRSTAAGQTLAWFSNYPYRESSEFANGFREAAEVLRKDADALKSLSQLSKPLGISINLATYGFLSSVIYATSLFLGDDEDEERGEKLLDELMTLKGFTDELTANAIALAGSRYAAGGKAMLQLGATIGILLTEDEEQQAKIKKILKNSVYLDPLPTQKMTGYNDRDKIISGISKYIPQFVMVGNLYADLIGTKNEVKAIYDKVQSNGIESLTEDEGQRILALNTLINSTQLILNLRGTSLPVYNKLKTYMRGLKEEAGVDKVAEGEAPANKKSSGGGGGSSRSKTINKSDLKKYYPELSKQIESAKGGADDQIKAIEKQVRDMKKNAKDQVYGAKD